MNELINALGYFTKLGGSIVHPEVRAAGDAVAEQFVDYEEFRAQVAQSLADFTGNEAAFITSGTTAGLTLALASAITGPDAERVTIFPNIPQNFPTEVVSFAGQENPYFYPAVQLGASVIRIGDSVSELRAALTKRTAAVVWFAAERFALPGITLRDVVQVAHKAGVPVIVDAASEAPPFSGFSEFTQGAGADVAIFSGGKALGAPQGTGLVLGKASLVLGLRQHSSPRIGVGRGFKVSKEDILSLQAAVHRLKNIENVRAAVIAEVLKLWIPELERLQSRFQWVQITWNGVDVDAPFNARSSIKVPTSAVADFIEEALWHRSPKIAVGRGRFDNEPLISLSPETLTLSEAQQVLDALAEVFSQAETLALIQSS